MQESDFNEWKQHPVTRELLKLFEEEIAEQGRQWSRGAFLNNREEEVGVLGRVAGYYALIELQWEDVSGMLKEQGT